MSSLFPFSTEGEATSMDVGSILSYPESSEELRQKLLVTTLELETMKKVKTELLDLLKMAYKERNEARDQLQKLVNKLMLMPSTSNEFKKAFLQLQPESLVMLHATKANSSITESNSLSHVSSPVDSSSPEFSNMNNVVDSLNFGGYLNHQPLVNDFNEKPSCDVANEVIDFLSKGKVLPQQGKLLQAVMDAGPLLQTLILAGPIITWRNPPPFQAIKVPPLKMVGKDFVTTGIELNSLANTWNSFQKPTPLSSSPCMLNSAGNFSGSWNNTWQLTPNASAKNHTSSRIQQRHQCF